MRKALGILIIFVPVCALVLWAMHGKPRSATTPAATVTVIINGNADTDGVDTPWFVLSKSAGETVSWTNTTANDCRVIYSGPSPFDTNVITVVHGTTSNPKSATNAPPPPAGTPADKVYKFYKYTVACEGKGGVFDPGNGMKP